MERKRWKFSFRNVRIGLKYLIMFIVTALLFVAAGTFAYFQLTSAKDGMNTYEESQQFIQQVKELEELVQMKDVHVADYIITKNEKYTDDYYEAKSSFESVSEQIEPLMETEQMQELFDLIVKNDEEMDGLFTDLISGSDLTETDEQIVRLRERSTGLRNSTIETAQLLNNIILQDQSKVMNSAFLSVDQSIYSLIGAVVAAVIVGAVLLAIINRRISRHLAEVVDMTTAIADGNIAVESMDYEGRDEIGQLAYAVNRMKENIRAILMNITHASESVSSSSEELTQSANEVKEGSEQTASVMQEIADGTETQANSAANLMETMSRFVELIQTSEEQGKEVTQASHDVIEVTTNGSTLMREAVGQMEQIDQIVSESVQQVQGLDEQSGEISQLVRVIQDIAEQTNLLALNAAIEAARAGEHGQGFAVVAEEVRKLAEQVSTSVHEITGIVDNIQAETAQVVSSLHKGYDEVKEGTTQIEKTGESFSTIDTAVSDMVEKILTISGNLNTIADNGQHMNGLIEDIAAVSEESAAGVEEAAASSEQTTSAMDEVSHNADELAKLAEKLNGEIQSFELE